MNVITQSDLANTTAIETTDIRDLLSTEIVLIGGGEIVVCGI